MHTHEAVLHPGLERWADVGDVSTTGLEVAKDVEGRHKEANVPIDEIAVPPPPATISSISHDQSLSEKGSIQAKKTVLVCGIRRSRFLLVAALAGLLLAAVVAASVVGGLFARQQQTASKTDSDTPCRSSADACDSPTESFSGQNSSSTPTAPPEPTGSSAFITPTSDCRSLSSNPNYLVFQNNATSITRDVSFNIQCDSDYKWPLVLAMRVYRFEDCIQACAVHATNSPDSYTACVVAVYKPDSGQSLTCWLKSRGPQAVMVNVGVDSARILGSL